MKSNSGNTYRNISERNIQSGYVRIDWLEGSVDTNYWLFGMSES